MENFWRNGSTSAIIDPAALAWEEKPCGTSTACSSSVWILSLIHISFGDWLTYWYENHSKPKIRPTTQETYESRIRLHIIPEIGDIPLNKLTQNDLQQFYGRLKKSGRKRFTDKYGEGLSDRMVRMCHATCRSALEKAVQDGLIRVNQIGRAHV